MLLDALFQNNQTQNMRYAKLLDNSTPLFSQFGRNIYASDVVQMCIDCIATECSKLQPKHIRTDSGGKLVAPVDKGLNRLFRCAPNELMTTHDFLEKVIWKLYLDYNSFIYPTYTLSADASGNWSRYYTGLYPLNPTCVEFLQDSTNALFVRFTFQNGFKSTLPYADVIHLRKKYSVNDIMGGGANGQPDNAPLLQTLQINDQILTGVGKAVQTSMQIKGILKLNTTLEDEGQKAERTALEKQITESSSGILTGDYKGDYQPIKIDPKLVDADTLDFLQNKILRFYGVSLPVLNGTATDDEQQAFYNKTLEPIVISMNQAFTKTLFTSNEINYGNTVNFYTSALETMTVKNKLAIMDGLGNRGALTDNQLLALFGYAPFDGGDVRHMSLNYIDVALSNDYQLARAGIDSKTPENNNGGTNNGKTE
ncbi:MAG: phage portal protein [Lentisphaeria bacterium]